MVSVIDIDGRNAANLTGINATSNPINRLLLGISLVRDAIELHTMCIDNVVVTED